MRSHPYKAVLAVAAILTLLNALRPLTIDDTAYHAYASQVARAPLDPYGFDFNWGQSPQPAFDILVPPLMPYWLSVPVWLTGGDPLACKLWMFPISVLFVGSLVALLRRWARGLEWPLLVLIVLSPAFLPSFNLMLDIPALTLSLSALALFARAVDRDSATLAAAAGILVGLAAETKYNELLLPAVLCFYALTRGTTGGHTGRRSPWRRWRLALFAAATGLALFAAWEGLMWHRYGQSHFVHHLATVQSLSVYRHTVYAALFTHAGAVGMPLLLLSLAALGAGRGWLVATGILLLLIDALVAAIPAPADILIPTGLPGVPGPITVGRFLYTLVGVALFLAVCTAATRLAVHRPVGQGSAHRVRAARWWRDPDSVFVAGWLLLELAGYFVFTPFPAVRRILGVLVAATAVAGRLAARTCRSETRRSIVRVIAAASVGLGLAVYAVDFRDAAAERLAVQRAVQRIGVGPQGTTIWFIGHWGFQFYAERAGMQAVAPGVSRLRRGDWLLVPDRIDKQVITLLPEHLEPVDPPIEVSDPLPLRTVPGFYGGLTPLAPQRGPRLTVMLYRVRDDFVPASPL